MAVFYIKTASSDIFELTSTQTVTVSETGTVTKYKMQDGTTATDNVVNANKTISFTGLISNIKSIKRSSSVSGSDTNTNSELDSVQGYVEGLRRLKESKELFTVHYDNRFPAAKNCAITSLQITRDKTVSLGYNVSLTLEQLRISVKADISTIREIQTYPNETAGQKNSGGNTTTDKSSSSSEPNNSLFLGGGEAISDFFSDNLSLSGGS